MSDEPVRIPTSKELLKNQRKLPMNRKVRKVNRDEILADQIVAGLIDRLFRVEKRLESVTRELNEHMEMIAEQQARVLPNGNVRLLAMSADLNSSESFTVEFSATVTPVKE